MSAEYDRYRRAELFSNTRYDKDKSQKDMCLDYLERYDTITPLEALTAFGCLRLGARISDLRKAGYDIKTEINPNGKRYAIYHLVREGDEYGEELTSEDA